MYIIRDKEAGNIIEQFNSYEEAQTQLEEYEQTDRCEGTYTADFYEVVENE